MQVHNYCNNENFISLLHLPFSDVVGGGGNNVTLHFFRVLYFTCISSRTNATRAGVPHFSMQPIPRRRNSGLVPCMVRLQLEY